MDITYQGDTPNLAVQLYSPMPKKAGISGTATRKHMSVNVRSRDFNSPVNVNLSDFKVADWWIKKFNITRELTHVELDRISSVGIGPQAPYSEQPNSIQINSISVAGSYFSKESLYASLLIFWALLLSSEALLHFWTLRQRISRDAAKLQTLNDISAKYKVKAETDNLTGLSNREGLAQMLKAIEQNNSKNQYALLLIDVDNFKGLNDQHGHDVGDLVLEELAQSISRGIRSTDIVCRWGGEEFVLLFRYAKVADVYPLAEKIRLEIANSDFAGTLKLHISVSIGTALMTVDDSFDKTFKFADQALYTAKRSGRNQTMMAQQKNGNNKY